MILKLEELLNSRQVNDMNLLDHVILINIAYDLVT